MCDVEADAADCDDLRDELRAKAAKYVQDNRLFKPVDGEPGVYLFEPNREQANELARMVGPQGTARVSGAECMNYNTKTAYEYTNGSWGHVCSDCGSAQTLRQKGIEPKRDSGRTGRITEAGGHIIGCNISLISLSFLSHCFSLFLFLFLFIGAMQQKCPKLRLRTNAGRTCLGIHVLLSAVLGAYSSICNAREC